MWVTAHLAGRVLVPLVLLASCGHGRELTGQPRRQWLEDALRARHADLLARDSAAVAEQLARMARSSFSFFRGSAGLHPDEPSRFLTPASSKVAVIGDPHPENIGTFRTPRGERVVDFNDFDLAGHGSYLADLRRLALGLWLTADMADLGRRQRERAVEEMCDGYLAELTGLGRGERPVSLRVESAFGGDLDAVNSILADGDPTEDGASVATEERALVERALASYRSSLLQPGAVGEGALVVKQVARVSSGIASLRLLRFRVRVEGSTAADGDDWTLELKQSDPASARALAVLQRELQEFPDNDPFLGWAAAGDRVFRVRGAGPEQRRLSVEKIARRVKSPQWRKRDLRELAHQCGRLLARGHARARASDGQPGLAALLAAVGDGPGLTRETVAVTARAAEAVEADRDHLRALLQQKGPLLGWQR
jgi:hypothetical protein